MEIILIVIFVIAAVAIRNAGLKAKKAEEDEARQKGPAKAAPAAPIPMPRYEYHDPAQATQRPVMQPRRESHLDTAHLESHPAYQEGGALEVREAYTGSLGVSYSGEGCDTDYSVRPAWEDSTVFRRNTSVHSLSRADLARGIIMAEVLGPRGGLARNRRKR